MKLVGLYIILVTNFVAQTNLNFNKNDISKIVEQFSITHSKVKTLYKDSVSYKNFYTDTVSNLKVIEIKTIENANQKKVKWYYYNNKYIYAIKIWQNAITLNTVDKEEFFINDTTLLQWTINDKPTDFNSNSNQEIALDLIKYGKNLLETINN